MSKKSHEQHQKEQQERLAELGDNDEPVEEEIEATFDATVEEGAQRLQRTFPDMLITGFFGGLEVGLGVMAYLLVLHETGNHLLAGLAFSIGFIALLLAHSELFTENFLVPVATVITRKGTLRQLGRLWSGTYVTNLMGGWLIAAMVMLAYPDLHGVASERGESIMGRALSLESFMLAVLAGAAITLMTWMQRNAESEGGRLLAVITIGFLLGSTHMNHVVVISIKMFAALQVGDTMYGYLDWLKLSSYAVVGNMIGGLGLVTLLRLVQVGRPHIERRRRTSLTLRSGTRRQRIPGED